MKDEERIRERGAMKPRWSLAGALRLKLKRVVFAGSVGLVSFVGLAQAGTVVINDSGFTIKDPFLRLDNFYYNPVGLNNGNGCECISIGATSVEPSANTIGDAYLTAYPGLAHATVNNVSQADFPNLFLRTVADGTLRRGDWSLTFTNTVNGNITSPINLTGIGTAASQAPFVQSITISGDSHTPTFSWTVPAGTSVSGYRVNIYDSSTPNNLGRPTQISSTNLLLNGSDITANGGTFTVPNSGNHQAGDVTIVDGTKYYVEIDVLQTRTAPSTLTDLNNANIAAMSRWFAEFQPLPSGTAPVVNLPTQLPDGSYQFNMRVTPGQTYYIDPTVASGYVFTTNPGGPNFASVTLPNLQVAPFTLSYYNGSTLVTVSLAGDTEYVFLTPGGVDTFTVTGIDLALALDPSNPTAFVAGLTFASEGVFNGTQTPITTDVADTPLPATLPLFATGLGALSLLGWRTRRKAAALAAGSKV